MKSLKFIGLVTMALVVYASVAWGAGSYYEVYGAQAGDYTLTTTGHQLLGTSNSSNTFNVSGYGRFIIYVPPSSSKILFDAFGLDSGWVNSAPGTEYAHYTSNMNHTGGTWSDDSFIEGPPDSDTMENTLGQHSYYGFSTLGASTLAVYVQSVQPSYRTGIEVLVTCPTSVTAGSQLSVTVNVKNWDCDSSVTINRFMMLLIGNSGGTLSSLGVWGPYSKWVTTTTLPIATCSGGTQTPGTAPAFTPVIISTVPSSLSGKMAEVNIEVITSNGKTLGGGGCVVSVK